MAEKIRKTFRNSTGQPVSGIASTLSLHNVDTGAILANFVELGVSGSYETSAEVPHGTWALYVSGVKTADEFVVDPTRTSSVNPSTFKDVLIDRVIGKTLSIYQFLRIADGDGDVANQTMLTDAVDSAISSGNVVEIGGKHAGGERNSLVISATKNFSISSASGYRVFIDLQGAILSFTGTPWSFNGVRPCFKNGIIQGDNNNSFPITFDRGADFEYIDFVNCDPTRDNTSTLRSLCYGCRGIPGQQFTDGQGDITTRVSIVGSADNTYGTIADTVISMADDFVPNGTGVTSTKRGTSTTMVKKFQKFIVSYMARTIELVGWMVGWTQSTFTALKYLADFIYPSVSVAKQINAENVIFSGNVSLATDLDAFRNKPELLNRFRGYVEQLIYAQNLNGSIAYTGDHYRTLFAFNSATMSVPPSSVGIKFRTDNSALLFVPDSFEFSVKKYYKLANGDMISDGHITQWAGSILSYSDTGDATVPNSAILQDITTYKPSGSTYSHSIAEGIMWNSANSNSPSNVVRQVLL